MPGTLNDELPFNDKASVDTMNSYSSIFHPDGL
jgi:hypothetical protein